MLFENVTSFCHDKPVVVQKIFKEGFEQGDFVSETLICAWHMSDDECEHYGHWMVYIINATLNDLFKSVLGNNQSQCRKYRIREWFLTNFAE